MISREGVAIEKEKIQDILGKVLEKEPVGFDENAPKFLLWEQQRKINLLKSISAMKWHPVIIRWCLSIYLKSSGNILFFSVTIHFIFCVCMYLYGAGNKGMQYCILEMGRSKFKKINLIQNANI